MSQRRNNNARLRWFIAAAELVQHTLFDKCNATIIMTDD